MIGCQDLQSLGRVQSDPTLVPQVSRRKEDLRDHTPLLGGGKEKVEHPWWGECKGPSPEVEGRSSGRTNRLRKSVGRETEEIAENLFENTTVTKVDLLGPSRGL